MSQLILIAGISRSGKSSLAKSLCQRIENAIHLDQDAFVKDKAHIPTIDNRIDWEHPASLDWSRWSEAIKENLLKEKLVIAEGIFAFHDLELCDLASLTIELNLKENEFLLSRRKENRWGQEPEWYLHHVWKSHLLNHNPHQVKPDLSIDLFSSIDTDKIVQLIISN